MQFEEKIIFFFIEIPDSFPYSRMTITTRRIFMGPYYMFPARGWNLEHGCGASLQNDGNDEQ